MLYEAYVQGIFWEIINNLVMKNKAKYQLQEDYYEGFQWSISWITTRAWMAVVNERKKGHIYYWVVDNKIKDSVDTIANLTYWLNGFKVSESEDIDINWEETIDKIAKQVLKYDRSFITIWRDNSNKIILNVLDTKDCYYIKDELGNIIEFIQIKLKDKEEYTVKSWELNWSSVIYREYYYENLQIESLLEIFPVYEIYWDFDYVQSLIPVQDIINSMKTQEFEINRMQGDPITLLKNVKLQDWRGKQIDVRDINLSAWSIVNLWLEWNLERLSGEWVTQWFLDALDREEKTFYKTAKLNGLRNDDLSGLTSWYAIELKMIDTISFVKKLRGKILNGLKPVLNILDELNGEESFELNFWSVIQTSLLDKIEEAKGLQLLGYTQEEIRNYIWI